VYVRTGLEALPVPVESLRLRLEKGET